MDRFEPSTWWLTGLPAAGKTTLAHALVTELRRQGRAACVLDGDELRRGLCSDLGFSEVDREENMRRAAHMAALLNQQGIDVVAALISPTARGRAAARQTLGEGRFFEVHVSTPLAVCMARDPKGLYARARATTGQGLGLTGLDAAYEVPAAPDARIDTREGTTPVAVQRLLALRRAPVGVTLRPSACPA
jgi:adenylylsulfate kinase